MEERTEQLSVANRELESFSYSVSHDLRAPLRHIAGYAEMLNSESAAQINEAGRRYLKLIMDSADRMSKLINDLLDFSRMGRAELRTQKISLDDVVRDSLHDLESETAGRNIAWKIAPLGNVIGDFSMLRQVLVNLIGNAVKFTRKRPQAIIEIGCDPGKSGEIVFSVRDNGVGFDMNYAKRLFGVFQRLHSQEDFEGTGIGLANVQRIIHRHGGRIWAESALDRGATFFFTLPQKKSDEVHLTAPEPNTRTA